MMESKVFADNFSRSFSESGDFFQFLSARQARSKWMTAPSKELRFEPVERGSTLGNLYMQIYDHNGDADVLEDTMENTSLLLKVDTSVGQLAIYAKHDKTDCAADYPGVFIDYVRKDGATAILACVEYDPNKEALQTVVYGNCASDEPTEIVEHYNTDFEE